MFDDRDPLCLTPGLTRAQGPRDLGAVLDAELAEDVREVALDRPVGEEERGRDLAVRLPFGDERGDPLLGRRERAGRRRAAADPLQLGPSALGPERCADPLEERERLLERRPRLAPPLGAALRSAEREQRAAAIERKLDLRVPPKRLIERRERVVEPLRLPRRAAHGSEHSSRAQTRARAAGRSPRTSRGAPRPRPVARARSAPRRGRRRTGSRRARRWLPVERGRRSARAEPGLRPAPRARAPDARAQPWRRAPRRVRRSPGRDRGRAEPLLLPAPPCPAVPRRGFRAPGCATKTVCWPACSDASCTSERPRQRALELAELQLHVTEEDEKKRRRALVAQLARAAQQLLELVTGPFELARPPQ